MRFLKQLSIILFLSFLGEILHDLIPLPIPASVYGLVLMLLLLQSHILKVDQVKETSEFLIEIMPVMFIPAGVGLLTSWDALKPIFIPVAVITAVTTVFVMAVTGKVTQKMIRSGKSRKTDREMAAGQYKEEATAGGEK
ncbi:MAG: CidA/LrgA family protein [Eubacteriales bacterium]|nr:CidA/LrgA family protein [Eubacteriales bacterium]